MSNLYSVDRMWFLLNKSNFNFNLEPFYTKSHFSFPTIGEKRPYNINDKTGFPDDVFF